MCKKNVVVVNCCRGCSDLDLNCGGFHSFDPLDRPLVNSGCHSAKEAYASFHNRLEIDLDEVLSCQNLNVKNKAALNGVQVVLRTLHDVEFELFWSHYQEFLGAMNVNHKYVSLKVVPS